ncbi:MAG: hypothetical protein EZS28_022727 [Streblomastix strix]|uniref:Uncharacterized protein n=1 Tax=Streblomastix strix TaxID=222440 RepID=A0A5J4VHD0_9EUKA|nr:MAG: hypothetical protein EZS28_022727 [Streblomastix strix]
MTNTSSSAPQQDFQALLKENDILKYRLLDLERQFKDEIGAERKLAVAQKRADEANEVIQLLRKELERERRMKREGGVDAVIREVERDLELREKEIQQLRDRLRKEEKTRDSIVQEYQLDQQRLQHVRNELEISEKERVRLTEVI